MAEAKCSRSIAARRGKDKGMNFPRNLCLRELQHPGDQAFGVRHVRSIFLTERFKHHLFFPPHAAGIEDACSNKSGTTCEPIWQQQNLSYAQQEKRRIHRMPDKLVHAILNQCVVVANLQRD